MIKLTLQESKKFKHTREESNHFFRRSGGGAHHDKRKTKDPHSRKAKHKKAGWD